MSIKLNIKDLSTYWRKLSKNSAGKWIHPDDEALFNAEPHSFNLDYPPPVFAGNIIDAKIIILNANGGFKPDVTPREFKTAALEKSYMQRLLNPATADWSNIATYYAKVNYGKMIASGEAAMVNACAYRSRKISKEPENRRLIKQLPSVAFTKSWLLDCVIPLARSGDKIIVAKRHGLWELPKAVKESDAIIIDPAPVSAHLSASVWEEIARRM